MVKDKAGRNRRKIYGMGRRRWNVVDGEEGSRDVMGKGDVPGRREGIVQVGRSSIV